MRPLRKTNTYTGVASLKLPRTTQEGSNSILVIFFVLVYFKWFFWGSWKWWHNPVIPATREAQIRESRSKASPYLKKTKAKKGWCVTQIVEHLPSKSETLSSNPSYQKEK
jgi:hypothetical protein